MHRIRAIFRRSTNCTGIEKPEILKFQTSQYKKEYPSAQDTLSSYQLKWLHQGSDRTHQDNQNDQRDTRYDKPGDRQAAGSSENSTGGGKKRLSGQQNTHNKLIFIYLQAS